MSDQIDLFGSLHSEQDPVGLAPSAQVYRDLARHLPSCLRFGTSSWTFPGWRNLVYGRPASEQVLARYGLPSYAAHPLLRGVGLDRTFYAPMARSEFERFSGQVPEDFRFLVKAHAALTTPARTATRSYAENLEFERYLDPNYACERVIEPAVAGLGPRLGTILFQFPPLGAALVRDPQRFAQRLHAFLELLPRGPAYAVELRNRELLCGDYAQALADVGASHCFNVHPQMPDVLTQADMLGEQVWTHRSVSVRWMLHPAFEYEDARRRYFPFDRLVDPDLRSRISLVELVTRVLTQAKDVLVIANNKAEGSAPNTIVKLAEECVGYWRDRKAEEN